MVGAEIGCECRWGFFFPHPTTPLERSHCLAQSENFIIFKEIREMKIVFIHFPLLLTRGYK